MPIRNWPVVGVVAPLHPLDRQQQQQQGMIHEERGVLMPML
jgi:hypothetical protein